MKIFPVRTGTGALLLGLIFCVANIFVYGESMVQRMDGRVVRADPENKILLVQYDHPVTNETMEKEFLVDKTTGFKRVKGLGKVKEGDLVTIDYREETGRATAVYVDVVPVDRQVVSPSEMARSLAQIKTSAKKG